MFISSSYDVITCLVYICVCVCVNDNNKKERYTVYMSITIKKREKKGGKKTKKWKNLQLFTILYTSTSSAAAIACCLSLFV